MRGEKKGGERQGGERKGGESKGVVLKVRESRRVVLMGGERTGAVLGEEVSGVDGVGRLRGGERC